MRRPDGARAALRLYLIVQPKTPEAAEATRLTCAAPVTAHPPFRLGFDGLPALATTSRKKVLDAVTAESILTTGCPSNSTSTT